MFERFDEKARRVVFFARYEASQRDSGFIELEDLLLGALREDPLLRAAAPSRTLHQLSEEIRAIPPAVNRKSATSTDLPLSGLSKRALAYAAEEAKIADQRTITAGHLVLGLLRFPDSRPAAALRRLGIVLESFREVVNKRTAPERPQPQATALVTPPALSPSLLPSLTSLNGSIFKVVEEFYDWRPEELTGLVAGEDSWTRKEALGHLIDLAMANQQWIAAALAAGHLEADNVPDKAWAEAQNYGGMNWTTSINLWVLVNRHLLHVIGGIPEDKLSIRCRVGSAGPVSLETTISQYADAVAEWIRKISSD